MNIPQDVIFGSIILISLTSIVVSLRKILSSPVLPLKIELEVKKTEALALEGEERKEKLEQLVADAKPVAFNPFDLTSLLSNLPIGRGLSVLIGLGMAHSLGPSRLLYCSKLAASLLKISGNPYTRGCLSVKTLMIALSLISYELLNRLMDFESQKQYRLRFVNECQTLLKNL
ncbi:hypothetical protein P9112_009659 [Eukaryota sp. TZLM1-RC]